MTEPAAGLGLRQSPELLPQSPWRVTFQSGSRGQEGGTQRASKEMQQPQWEPLGPANSLYGCHTLANREDLEAGCGGGRPSFIRALKDLAVGPVET